MEGTLTVYKASAGSGKTFTLATQYIALLLAGDTAAYRHILAVTFTNKATGEMKERILGQLYGISRGLAASEGYLDAVRRQLPDVTPAELRRRATVVLRRIVHDYDRFHVGTIDSFFQSVMTGLAHELGLAAGFHVDINDTDAVGQAVDRLMGSLQPHTPVLRWVIDYIRERIDDNRRWDITREVKKLATQLLAEPYLTNEDRLRRVLDDNEALRRYRDTLRQAAEEATDHVASAVAQLEDLMEGYELDFAAFSRGSTLATYLRKIKEGQGEAPNATIEKYLADGANWLRKKDQQDARLVSQCDELREVLCVVEEMRRQCAQVVNNYRLTTAHLGPLRLLGEIGRQLTAIDTETGRFMLARVPILLARLVGEDDAPFVFEKAGTTFRHVMIDEFQDTSTLQWRNFKSLLVENMAAAHSCLLVGDVKQSIYRFRGGDWSLLHGIQGEFPHHPVAVRNLAVNYRSERTVVDFNNRFFARAAAALDGLAAPAHERLLSRIYADVAQQCAKADTAGYVRIRFYDRTAKGETDPEAERLDDLADCIDRLHREGVPYTDMAVLVRWNREASALVRHFATVRPDLPLVSDEAFLLASSEAVQLLVHAMRYLHDATDTIALAYVARHHAAEPAPWPLCTGTPPAALAGGAFLSRRDELAALPLYELQEALIRLFGLDRRPGQGAYLAAYLDQVLLFLDEHPSDLGAFLEYWNDILQRRAIPAAEVDGLRVLTIHKAKGLQFHTVLLPYCDWPLERDRNGDLLWCEPQRPPYNELPLVPITPTSRAEESIYAADYAEEHFQRRTESLNLLYVAFTRAERNLLVWAAGRTALTGKTSTTGDLIGTVLADALPGTFEEGTPYVRPSDRASGEDNRLAPRPATLPLAFESFESRVTFRQSNQSQEFVHPAAGDDARQEAYIDQGVLLHKVFSALATSADVDRVLDEVDREGLLGDRVKRASLRRLIGRGLASPQVAGWFDGSWTLFREVAILSRTADGQLRVRRPDRVMTRPDETVVVDFKFGRPLEEHATQVREYFSLLSAMGHPAPRGYLWYVYTNQVQEVKP